MRVRLDSVCDIFKGKTTITKALPGEYPLVVTAEERSTSNSYDFDTKAVCVPLVSATGHGHASIKRVHYQEGKFALGTILAAVIPKDSGNLDVKYLHIYLSYFKDLVLVPLMRGSANVSLTIKSLGTAQIHLPTIERQKQIVEHVTKIELERSELDKSIQEQQLIINLMREKILQLAVQGKLVSQDPNDEPASVLLERIKEEKERLISEEKLKREKPLTEIGEDEKPYELPEGWELARLVEISTISTGSTPLKANIGFYQNGYIPWITSSATGNDFIDSAEFYLTDKALNECSLTLNPIGTLVVAMYGQGKTRGQVSELLIEAATNQACATINPFDDRMKKYIKLYFKKIYNEIRELAVGGAQPNLNLIKIKNYIIPLPPINEQNRIVEKVSLLMALCDELESRIVKSKKYSENLIEAVLKEAFKA